MKNQVFLLLAMLTALTEFLYAKDRAIISGTITGDIKEQVEYACSENGSCFYGFPKTIQLDSQGNFKVILDIDKPTFFQPLIGTYSYGTLVIEPNGEYKIDIDLNSKDKSIKPICDNEKGQILYNKLLKKNINSIVRNYRQNDNLLEIKKQINLAKVSEIDDFKELLANKDISKSFFKLVKLDRECFYSLILGKVTQTKYLKSLRNKSDDYTSVKDIWGEVFQITPVSATNLISSFWYYQYVENYLSYKMFTSDSFDKDELMKIHKQGLIHTHHINMSINYLNNDELEYYQARYLYESALQMKFEEELIKLFNNFKIEYPQSEFSSYLYPLINPISNYIANKNQDDERIKYISNYKNLNSLKECLLPFKGKKVYVDIWASWCLPCRAQFKYKDNLKKVLEAENVEMLYLSIDKKRYDKKWNELVRFYNLEGHHIRANSKLYGDLMRIFDANNRITIPWYLIIDEQGNIIEKHAKSPSQIKELETQLKQK